MPLRLRVAAAFAASLAVVLAGLAVFLHARLGVELRRGVDLELRARAGVITAALAQQHPVPIDTGRSVIDPDEAFAQVLDRTGHILDASDSMRAHALVDVTTLAAIHEPEFRTARVTGVDDPARLLIVPMADRSAAVVVGANLGDTNEALARLQLLLWIGIPAALVLASLIGWLVAGVALRPVEQIRREAAALSVAGTGEITVPHTGDELARLAGTLNELLDRERQALEAEHRFLDEASHDLRTPLGVLKAELDLALSRPRTTSELEQAVRAASRETDQLVRLAEDLLVLARARRGPMSVHREPVRLDGFLRECGRAYPASVEASGLVVDVDAMRLRQAVCNVLDNSLRHAGDTAVTVAACRRAPDTVSITVRDHGPGFPPAVIGRLQRSESLRSGLGLSIVAAVAEAHGGYAEAANASTGGAVVTLVLRA